MLTALANAARPAPDRPRGLPQLLAHAQLKIAPVCNGVRAYVPARAAMMQFAGSRRAESGRTELGLWHVDAQAINADRNLSLGVRFQTEQENAGIQIHHIEFVRAVPDHAVRIGLRVTDTRSGGDAVLVTMTVALGREAIDDGIAAAAECVSFKMNYFVPRSEVASFLARANGNALFNDVSFAFDQTSARCYRTRSRQ